MRLLTYILALPLIAVLASCSSPDVNKSIEANVVQKKENKYLFFFRPGEESRMLARCQFTLNMNGACSAIMTYPIKGNPWRRNICRHYNFTLDEETTTLLFSEFFRIWRDFPGECIPNNQTWSDTSEEVNNITRDRKSNTLCYSIGIYSEDTGDWEEYFWIRENSEVLLNSELYKIISDLITPYEKL